MPPRRLLRRSNLHLASLHRSNLHLANLHLARGRGPAHGPNGSQSSRRLTNPQPPFASLADDPPNPRL